MIESANQSHENEMKQMREAYERKIKQLETEQDRLRGVIGDYEKRLDSLWAELRKHVPIIAAFNIDWRHGTLKAGR